MDAGDLVPLGYAGRREWIGLGVIALPCLLYSMDLTVLNLAVPSLSKDLKPSSTELLWIIDIYGFLVAGSLITMGTLGDRIGRSRPSFPPATSRGARKHHSRISASRPWRCNSFMFGTTPGWTIRSGKRATTGWSA